MADAVVVATTRDFSAQIVTSDRHFEKINGVKFVTQKYVPFFHKTKNKGTDRTSKAKIQNTPRKAKEH